MVIRQRDHAGAEADRVCALARRGQEHLGRCNGLPAAAVVFTAPELLEAPRVEMLYEVEITLEQSGRTFAQRMMGCQKGAELHSCHLSSLEE